MSTIEVTRETNAKIEKFASLNGISIGEAINRLLSGLQTADERFVFFTSGVCKPSPEEPAQ